MPTNRELASKSNKQSAFVGTNSGTTDTFRLALTRVQPTETDLRGHEGGLLPVTRRQWLNQDRSSPLAIAGILNFALIRCEVNSMPNFLIALSVS